MCTSRPQDKFKRTSNELSSDPSDTNTLCTFPLRIRGRPVSPNHLLRDSPGQATVTAYYHRTSCTETGICWPPFDTHATCTPATPWHNAPVTAVLVRIKGWRSARAGVALEQERPKGCTCMFCTASGSWTRPALPVASCCVQPADHKNHCFSDCFECPGSGYTKSMTATTFPLSSLFL